MFIFFCFEVGNITQTTPYIRVESFDSERRAWCSHSIVPRRLSPFLIRTSFHPECFQNVEVEALGVCSIRLGNSFLESFEKASFVYLVFKDFFIVPWFQSIRTRSEQYFRFVSANANTLRFPCLRIASSTVMGVLTSWARTSGRHACSRLLRAPQGTTCWSCT